nr:hypothetical protein [uncultured Prevotella sp.]
MKKVLLFLVMLMTYVVSFAQSNDSEKIKPLLDTEIVRKCANLDIEGKYYENVTVTIKSNEPDYVWIDKYKVKVTVTDASGNKVWKKTLNNSFLYVFSDGQIQIGKKNFYKMVILRSSSSGNWEGVVREKEGVY